MTRTFIDEWRDDDTFEDWLARTTGEDRSFFPLDLDVILDGTLEPEQPTFLERSDGAKLLYDGRLHWLAAEPEAGKTWFAVLAVSELLRAGRVVVYFDYETSARELVKRLVDVGTPRESIRQYFKYIQPPSRMSQEVMEYYAGFARPEESGLEPGLLAEAALVVFDACTEAMATDNLDPLSNVDVAKWLQRLPRVATRLGAAVLVLDHVPKDRENRGRYAFGAQHKLAQTDVQYTLVLKEPFRPGGTGASSVKVEKDRLGGVRQNAQKKFVGTLVLKAESPQWLDLFIAAPLSEEELEDHAARVQGNAEAAILETASEPVSKSKLEGNRSKTNRDAVAALIRDGRLVVAPGDEGKKHPKYVRKERQ